MAVQQQKKWPQCTTYTPYYLPATPFKKILAASVRSATSQLKARHLSHMNEIFHFLLLGFQFSQTVFSPPESDAYFRLLGDCQTAVGRLTIHFKWTLLDLIRLLFLFDFTKWVSFANAADSASRVRITLRSLSSLLHHLRFRLSSFSVFDCVSRLSSFFCPDYSWCLHHHQFKEELFW